MSQQGHSKAGSIAALIRASGGAGAILIAALLVGFAYNQLSPLGIRAAQSGAEAQAPKPSEPPITRVEGSPYGNQTVAVAWIDSESAPSSGPIVSSNAPLPQVSWPEVKPAVERGAITLVDARMPFQFQAGHIPGAVSLPINSTEADLDAFAASVSRARPIVVYCSNAECPMADRLGQMLVGRFAYRNVRVLQGGFVAFRQAEARAPSSNPTQGAESEETL